MKNVTEFVVDRSFWLRGLGSRASFLRSDSGEQCCMGFYADACEMPIGNGQIKSLSNSKRSYLSKLGIFSEGEAIIKGLYPSGELWRHSAGGKLLLDIYEINDDPKISDEVREELITEKCAVAGLKVTFIN